LSVLSGCGGISDQKRLENALGDAPLQTVVKVGGKILIDGEPAEDVSALVYSADGTKRIDFIAPVASNAEGDFVCTTYKQGDGLPVGEYKLAFDGRKFKRSKGEFSGIDKLNGRYSNALKSTFTLSVVEGEPQTELEFDLKSKN